MATVERHVPGTFNWFELATTNQSAAKHFYSQLFGWEATDSPMGPGEVYTIFKLQSLDAAACYTLRPDMLAQNVPPHWDIYLAVESADETAAAIESFGGKMVCAPFDVMTHGRMAVATDPTGAYFCIWQSFSHIGTRIDGVWGTVCWADLVTPDPEAAGQFYSGVFGWEVYASPTDSSGYLHIKAGERHIGGIPPAHLMPPGVPPHWMLYFGVEDIKASTSLAEKLGATTIMPPTALPNAGTFSIIKDPQGAVLTLFQPAPRG